MDFLCQVCHQAKATVHITETIPEKRERHLCDECAAQEGVIVKQTPETTQEILQQFIKHKTGLRKGENLECPRCGMTFREFQNRGLLGCPQCYAALGKVLTPLINRAHGGATHHVGKVPPKADDETRRHTGLLRLKRELKQAIEDENYELAAKVRDQIRALESAESA